MSTREKPENEFPAVGQAVRSVVGVEAERCRVDVVPDVLAAIAHMPQDARPTLSRLRVRPRPRQAWSTVVLAAAAGLIWWFRPMKKVASEVPTLHATIESVEFFETPGIIIEAKDVGATLVWQMSADPEMDAGK